jgi:thymidylate synthase
MEKKNNLDPQYNNLLKDILENGIKKQTRNGEVISVFGRQIRHSMSDGFPLLTGKKMFFKGIITELLWFLKGETNIKYLVDNGCHIWDGDAYKNYMQQYNVVDAEEYSKGYEDQCWGYPVLDHVKPTTASYKRGQINAYLEGKADKPFFYLTQEEFINKIKTDDEFAKKWGELGPIYGKQWRSWGDGGYSTWTDENDKVMHRHRTDYPQVDQIANLINDLKTNPDSRRLMVNAWNVGELDEMVLPPCHYGFQVYTRELSLKERVDYGTKRNMWRLGQTINYLHCDEMNIPTRAISLMWNQRSVDTFLGLPFNIASYGLLLEIIAKMVNMVPDELIGNLGDVHLYSNHIEQAKEQIGKELTDEERYNIWFNNNYETGMERYFDPNNLPDFDNEYYEPTPKTTREPFELPRLKFNPIFLANLEHKSFDEAINGQINFYLENYQSHPSIKAPLSN